MKKEIILQGMGWGHLPEFLVRRELRQKRWLAIAGKHLPGGVSSIVAPHRRAGGAVAAQCGGSQGLTGHQTAALASLYKAASPPKREWAATFAAGSRRCSRCAVAER